jgi:starvation-inducible DNA-binding protein
MNAMTFESAAGRHVATARKACEQSVVALNGILADTITLRDLYKRYHWQASGASFYDMHLLCDSHQEDQSALGDAIAERIQALGGMPAAMAAEVARATSVPSPPASREAPLMQLARLIDAHKRALFGMRAAARRAIEIGDDATNELLVADVIPVNENQARFVREQAQRSARSEVLSRLGFGRNQTRSP